MSEEKVNPFDSFTEVYNVLIWTGFFKLLNKPKSRFKIICHQFYRLIAFLLVIGYNFAHIIYMIQVRDNWEKVFDVLVIEIPQVKMLTKILSLNLNMPKVDKMYDLLNGPLFAANTKKDEEILLENTKKMHRFIKLMKIYVTLAGIIMWTASLFAKRFQDPTAVVAAYRPFESDTWTKYSLSVFLEVLPLPWTAFAHLAFDCLVATYYAQGEVQLRIIKYNLEHLFDTDDASSDVDKDIIDEDRKRRFVYYLQRYEAVAWYTKTVGEVFSSSMSFEFFTSGTLLCMVTYQISSIPLLSVPFLFLILMLMVTMAQVFLYCYFGNMVRDESSSVITSIYLSDWLSATPEMRRLILIAMLRWSHSITPTVYNIIPLSLNTFVTVLRSAYSLFAVLKTNH